MPRKDIPIKKNPIVTMPNNPDIKYPPALMPAKPSFLQTIKEGVGYGIGGSIGHRIVGSIMESTTSAKPAKLSEYEQCMKDHNTEACELYLKYKETH